MQRDPGSSVATAKCPLKTTIASVPVCPTGLGCNMAYLGHVSTFQWDFIGPPVHRIPTAEQNLLLRLEMGDLFFLDVSMDRMYVIPLTVLSVCYAWHACAVPLGWPVTEAVFSHLLCQLTYLQ